MSSSQISLPSFVNRNHFINWVKSEPIPKDSKAAFIFIQTIDQNLRWVNHRSHRTIFYSLSQCVRHFPNQQDLVRSIQSLSEKILNRFADRGHFEEVKDVLYRSPLNLRVTDIFQKIVVKLNQYKNNVRDLIEEIESYDKKIINAEKSKSKDKYELIRRFKRQQRQSTSKIEKCADKLSTFHKISKILSLFEEPQFFYTNQLKQIVCHRGNPPAGFDSSEGLLLSMRKLNLSIIEFLKYGKAVFYFTQSFYFRSHFEDRPLIFCFVKLGGSFYPRLLWLSGSQGLWRRADKVFPDWIGKSVRGEEGVTLPFEICKTLSEIYENDINQKPKLQLPEKEGERFLKYVIDWSNHERGPRRRINGRQMFETNSPEHRYTPVGAESLDEDEENEIELGLDALPNDPKNNNFIKNENIQIKFEDAQILYTFTSPVYGELEAVAIPSKNNQYKFLFLEQAESGFVFLAGAEVRNVPVTNQGLKTRRANLNKLSLPLLEYPRQFLPNHGRDKFREDFYAQEDLQAKKLKYANTWNYLRQMPVIQDYFRLYKKKKVPDPI